MYKVEDNVITYDARFCINCSYGDSTLATHDPVGVGPKCCYDNDCEDNDCEPLFFHCWNCEQWLENDGYHLVDGDAVCSTCMEEHERG